MSFRILIPDAQFKEGPTIEEKAAGPGFTFDIHHATNPAMIPDESWANADAVLVYHEITLTAALAAKLPKCRIVVRGGVGYDNVDLAAFGSRGVPVCNTPDYGTTDVADHAIAMMLTLARGIATYDEVMRKEGPHKGWRFEAAPATMRLRGKTFGVVGLGNIGKAAALRAKAFGMDVAFYDPYAQNGTALAMGFRKVWTLKELLEQSDVVSLHAPLTTETRGMIGAEQLAWMKPGAMLINTARGPIADPNAIVAAIKIGKLLAAGLDVIPVEPPGLDEPYIVAWQEQPDWLAGRLLLSPHAAFYSPESFNDLRGKSTEVIARYLRDGMLINCVNGHLLKQ